MPGAVTAGPKDARSGGLAREEGGPAGSAPLRPLVGSSAPAGAAALARSQKNCKGLAQLFVGGAEGARRRCATARRAQSRI